MQCTSQVVSSFWGALQCCFTGIYQVINSKKTSPITSPDTNKGNTMIINNNNNNNNQGGCGTGQYGYSNPRETVKPNQTAVGENMWNLENVIKKHDRAAMIKLASSFGWSGLHYFHFGKPFWGTIHLLLSIIGIVGACSLTYLFIFCDNPGLYLRVAIALIPALLISILSGVICSLYWTMHDDDCFYSVYPEKEKEEKVVVEEVVEEEKEVDSN